MMWKRRIIMPSSCELSLSAKPKEALENERRKKKMLQRSKKQLVLNLIVSWLLWRILNLHISHIPVMLKPVAIWKFPSGRSYSALAGKLSRLYTDLRFLSTISIKVQNGKKKVRNRTFHKIFPSSPDWRCTNNESDETGGGSNGVALRSVCWSIENYLKKFWMEKKAQIMICISDVDDVLFMNRQGNIFTDDIIPCSFIHSNHQILRNFFW